MDSELLGLLFYLGGSLAFGGVVVGAFSLYHRHKKLAEERERRLAEWEAQYRKKAVVRTFPAYVATGAIPYPSRPSAPVPTTTEVIHSSDSGLGNALVAGLIGYELGKSSGGDDSPVSSPDPAPMPDHDGDFGGGGASDSWDSGSSDSGSSFSSDN